MLSTHSDSGYKGHWSSFYAKTRVGFYLVEDRVAGHVSGGLGSRRVSVHPMRGSSGPIMKGFQDINLVLGSHAGPKAIWWP